MVSEVALLAPEPVVGIIAASESHSAKSCTIEARADSLISGAIEAAAATVASCACSALRFAHARRLKLSCNSEELTVELEAYEIRCPALRLYYPDRS